MSIKPLSPEDLKIVEAIEKSLIDPKKLSSITQKHMRHTVKLYIINKITSHKFTQQELDVLSEKGKTAKGIAEIFEHVINLAVDNSIDNKTHH